MEAQTTHEATHRAMHKAAAREVGREEDEKEAALLLWGSLQGSAFPRKKCWDQLGASSKPLKARMSTVYSTWTLSSLGTLMRHKKRREPIFIDIYKECNTRGMLTSRGQSNAPGISNVRAAVVVSARGLLMSSRCYWKDEQAYEGIIDFVDQSQWGVRYWQLANMSATQRETLAESRFRRFVESFGPETIFERAGVYRMIEERLRRYGKQGSGSASPSRVEAATAEAGPPRGACFHKVPRPVEEEFPDRIDLQSPIV